MRFAEKNGLRILPNPLDKNAICPLCRSSVISRCGKIKMWHWSHKNNQDCDNWGDGETMWHLNWKKEFPEEYQEIIIGNHRADIKMNDIVLEFQNSSISPNQIRERENYYGKIIWVLNGETFARNLNIFPKKGFYSFKWKWFPKSWLISEKPIHIDLSYMKSELIKQIEKYSNGEKHYSSYTEETWEWEDDYGNIRDSDYAIYIKQSYEDTEKYLEKLNSKLNILIEKDIFLIKKLYNKGTGWGIFISKKDFIQGVKDGYYGY